MSKSGLRSDETFCSVPQALGGAFVGVVMAYAFQGLIPAPNNDDVRQLQSPEVMAMVTQGRWFYYFLFNKVFDQNPLPGFSTFVGSACLVGASWMHAKLIGLKHPTSVLILSVVSSISIYYGYMFDFDSTRIAYPLGNILSAVGLVVVLRSEALGPRVVGVVLLSLGPALYPATLMYQVTLLISAAMYWSLQQGSARAMGRVLRGLLFIVAGVVVYRVSTIVIYAVAGFQLDDRGSLNVFGLRDNWDTIGDILVQNALPFIPAGDAPAYFSRAYSFMVLVIFGVFLVSTLLVARRGMTRWQTSSVVACFAALLISPFFLVVITATDYYPIRSLYSFAAVYGALLAIAFERVSQGGVVAARAHRLSSAVLAVAVVFALINAGLIGQKSYDQSLAWQSDVAHVNRIIYRIDELIGDEPSDSTLRSPSAQIPIVVVGDAHWRSGPRGDAVRAWIHPWSREYIFGLIDSRFVPAAPQERERVLEAGTDREAWPSRESVFVEDGVVVVVR